MSEDRVDVGRRIRQAIGGDQAAVTWIVTEADSTVDPVVIAMAALLERRPERLDRALTVAAARQDRQLVAIVDAYLADDHELVDALAREHLVDHPDSFIVAWIASNPDAPSRGPEVR